MNLPAQQLAGWCFQCKVSLSQHASIREAPLHTCFVVLYLGTSDAKSCVPSFYTRMDYSILDWKYFGQTNSCYMKVIMGVASDNLWFGQEGCFVLQQYIFLFLQQTAVTVRNYLLVRVCPSLSQPNRFLLAWNLTKPNHPQEHSLQENAGKMERKSLISKNRIIVYPKFTNGVFKCVSIFFKTCLVWSCSIV